MNVKCFMTKAAAIIGVILLFAATMFVLRHEVKNGQKTTELLPQVSDTPIYVECEQGKPLEVLITPTEDFSAGGLNVLLVNISAESQGSFQISVKDAAGNVLADELIPVNTIVPGEWTTISTQVSYQKGMEYTISFLADGSEPYFMKLSEIDSAGFPFTEEVRKDGQPVDAFVSIGMNLVTARNLTFGDVLYYSREVAIAAAIFAILWILLGKKRITEWIKRIPFTEFWNRFGNDLFLLLVFLFLGMHIFVNAYLKGVYISADSSGYLREAVNLVNGNGFAFDGLAGYRSWFANWPILYPAMIALVMIVTKANAYLASKILMVVIIGVILLVLRHVMKKDAWLYSLCLLNLGFMNLSYYTWSEIPFILFLLIFAITLGKIIESKELRRKDFVLLGISGICCFLTRYFGIYIWLVVGLYLLILWNRYRKNRKQEAGQDNRLLCRKMIYLAGTAFIGGCISVGYMGLNKIMNGMASGVSRGLWWDDYEILTNDLIESLLTEITNAFCIQIPQMIDALPFSMKVWILVVLFVLIAFLIKKSVRPLSRESVLLTLGVSYYLIFIVIRYRSSMDSFYFRFFEPASFLLCIAFIGLLLPRIKGKAGVRYFAGVASSFLLIIMISMIVSGDLNSENAYYNRLAVQWDQAYREIPAKSVVIFDDIDFRSAYYRADVIDGLITPQDTYADLQKTYYGSDYLCIRKEFVDTMLASGEYDTSVTEKLSEALQNAKETEEYLVIGLR